MPLPAYPLTRALSMATAVYIAALVTKPSRLSSSVDGQIEPTSEAPRLAGAWASRDLPVSALALLGPPSAVPYAVGLRVAGDLGDAITLGSSTTGEVRRRVLMVTMGWGAINVAAYLADRAINR